MHKTLTLWTFTIFLFAHSTLAQQTILTESNLPVLVIATDTNSSTNQPWVIVDGITPFGQYTRDLRNSSYNIILSDPYGNIIDQVHYEDSAPWPTTPDGNGPYLQLFDLFYDNSLASS